MTGFYLIELQGIEMISNQFRSFKFAISQLRILNIVKTMHLKLKHLMNESSPLNNLCKNTR